MAERFAAVAVASTAERPEVAAAFTVARFTVVEADPTVAAVTAAEATGKF
jgi:phage-related baseplate assembly protein